jgi:hypothetical protein
MSNNVRLVEKVEIESIWASPKPGMSIDELYIELVNLGMTVYEVDRVNGRIRIR